MGCSPSKGQLFGGAAGLHSPLPSTPEGDHLVLKPGEGEHPGSGTDEGAEELPSPAPEEPLRSTKAATMAPSPAIVSSPEGVANIQVNMESQERDIQGEQLTAEKQMKKGEKRRNIKGSKQGRLREKERKSSVIRIKVDLPVHMVKAHQAAYAYLNPNISKYETLLGLLDHAAQTQLSLRPMMAAIVLRFEEVNQALEEMAEEGELMLKEHGDHMAWPSGMRVLPPMPTKPSTGTSSSDPPPDLLQQMLQHSTEKLRLLGSSVHSLGDNTLEEAVEYFASLSKLLSERLQNKRVAEGRLTQVLACVEVAAMRKSTPEDSALHSEDSGIGGENESLAGSDRCRRHRGSSGSGSSAHITPHSPPSQVCLNEGEEEEEEDNDDYEDEEDEKEEGARSWRKRSNSSPPDPSQLVLPVPPKHSQGQLPRRPLTAAPTARPQHSQSTECLNSLLELQKNQIDLDQRMRKMADRAEGGASNALYRAGLRSQSSGPLKGNQTASSLPALRRPGCHSVRRLINTFSKGVDGRPGQSLANIPPHIRGSRRNGSPLLPDIWAGEGGLINNGNNNNNGWSVDGREDMDMDSLPPPPPEVLMDNSFQSTVETPREEEGLEEDSGRGRPTVRQRSGISQRLRASVQNVTVLPDRGSMGRAGSLCVSPARPVRQDSAVDAQHCQGTEQSPQADVDPEKEQAASLYRQARKIIHLRNAAESPVRRSPADQGPRGPSPLSGGLGLRQGNGDYCEADYPCSHRPTTPPVSRARLPPSCASVHHRLPSPPAHKDQPTCPSLGQWRSPSRPGSPRIKTWARDNCGEENESPSMSFSEARSVFCQNSQTWTLSCSSTLLSPCGDVSQGRLPTRRPQTSVRHSQSDGRPRLITQAEPGVVNSTDRLNSSSVTEGDSQSDPSAGAPNNLNPEQ